MSISQNGSPSGAKDYGRSGTVAAITAAATVNAGTNTVMRFAVSWRDVNFLRTVSSITWNGSSTGVTEPAGALVTNTSVQNQGASNYYLVAPTTGTHNVVFTLSGVIDRNMTLSVDCWDGVDQSTPVGDVQTATVFDNSPTRSLTAAAGNLSLGVCHSFTTGGDLTTPNTIQDTESDAVVVNQECAQSVSETATNPTLSWTNSGATTFGFPWLVSAIVFLAAGAGGGDTPMGRMIMVNA